MKKEYEPGLTLVDEMYQEEHKEYKKRENTLSENIIEKMFYVEDKLKIDFLKQIFDDAEVKKEYEEFYIHMKE